jgi:aminopeptidase N
MLSAAAILVLAAPAGAAKPKASLDVVKLGAPPAQVEQGGTFAISGRVANRGEKGAAATVRFALRRGPDSGPLGVRLRARRVDEVLAGDSVRFVHTMTVPSDTAPGEYGIAACVRKRGKTGPRKCEAAPSRMSVTGPRVVTGEDSGPTDPGTPPPTGPACDPGPLPGDFEPGPDEPAPPGFAPGARSAGDPLLPQLGNGGYDVDHYDIALDYDPVANNFDSAATTITADATQNLSEFSLDLQGLNVTGVTVDGQPAAFSRTGTKLVVDPAGEGIPDGEEFVTVVSYQGAPQEITDPDGSKEGWIRNSGPTPDGGFVVNEPMGAQGWFPSNNYPTDKATFDFRITVPLLSTALGNGVLVGGVPPDNGDGTRTWHWRMSDPMATYLTTATVGNFVFSEETITETTPDPDRSIPEHRAIDVTYAGTLPVIQSELDHIEPMTNFLGGLYGAYPFDSTGAVVDSAPAVGYALEVQTKSHFATPLTPASRSTLLHEVAHQWFGNSVTLASWSDIWFNEGWAVWSEWFWSDETGEDSTTPEEHFDTEYAGASESDWAIAPAVLDGDPANLFANFPVYVRSAMTLQGYREIVGHAKFVQLARRLTTDYAYDNISTAEFIAVAKDVSGFACPGLRRLDDYFQQWLYGETKPTITPDTF